MRHSQCNHVNGSYGIKDEVVEKIAILEERPEGRLTSSGGIHGPFFPKKAVSVS